MPYGAGPLQPLGVTQTYTPKFASDSEFTTTQDLATRQNLSSMPYIKDLTNMVNDLNIKSQQKANSARIPGAEGLEATSSANIGAALRGEVPADVQALLAQRGAELGIGTGQVGGMGGGNVNAAYLRALGLTSLDQQNRGQSWLTNAYARNPAATPVDPTKFMLSADKMADIRLAESGDANAIFAAFMGNQNRPNYSNGGNGGGGGGGVGGYVQPTTTLPDRPDPYGPDGRNPWTPSPTVVPTVDPNQKPGSYSIPETGRWDDYMNSTYGMAPQGTVRTGNVLGGTDTYNPWAEYGW